MSIHERDLGREQMREVELKIVEPTEGRGAMIEFVTTTPKNTDAYHVAMLNVLKRSGVRYFVYRGEAPVELPGHHAWEVGDMNREDLEKLLPLVHAEAKMNMSDFFQRGNLVNK